MKNFPGIRPEPHKFSLFQPLLWTPSGKHGVQNLNHLLHLNESFCTPCMERKILQPATETCNKSFRPLLAFNHLPSGGIKITNQFIFLDLSSFLKKNYDIDNMQTCQTLFEDHSHQMPEDLVGQPSELSPIVHAVPATIFRSIETRKLQFEAYSDKRGVHIIGGRGES